MKKYIVMFLCLFAGVVCLPSMGMALNSGAHIYVTEKVYSSNDIDLLYGCIAPDLADYVPNPEMWENGFEDTHHNYIILRPQGWTEPWKRFSIGWMVHNEEWGEDWYSHIEYTYRNGVTGNGYVIDKALQLLPVLAGLPASNEDKMLMAHIAVEFAIDILVQQNLDPTLGQKIHDVAITRSDEDVRRLFNILVAKNKVVDRETLYSSEEVFRNLIIGYSDALANSNPGNLVPIAEFGGDMAYNLLGVDIPTANVIGIIQYAMYFCSADYDEFLEDMINGIKADVAD
jgi:hypothetical protein